MLDECHTFRFNLLRCEFAFVDIRVSADSRNSHQTRVSGQRHALQHFFRKFFVDDDGFRAPRLAVTPLKPARYFEGSILKFGYARNAGTAPSIIAPANTVIPAIPCGMTITTRSPDAHPVIEQQPRLRPRSSAELAERHRLLLVFINPERDERTISGRGGQGFHQISEWKRARLFF